MRMPGIHREPNLDLAVRQLPRRNSAKEIDFPPADSWISVAPPFPGTLI